MQSLINNYQNGNLTDAKRQAKRFSILAISVELIEQLGYGPNKAYLTAAWLKGRGNYQVACDAV